MTGEKKPLYLPARFVLVFLLFWAAFISYALRTNLSLTMVAMVNQTAEDPASVQQTPNSTVDPPVAQCTYDEADNSTKETVKQGHFAWNMKTQGFLQGGFFYGYASTQILNGWLSSRVGAKYLVAAGMLLGSICTLLSPLLAELGPIYLMVARVVTGISQSVLYPSINTLFLWWIPPLERSRMYNITNSGANFGVLVSMPVIGWLCEHGFAGGWPSVFYVFGSLGLVWVVVWLLLAHDSPKDHPRISLEERKRILDSLPRKKVRPVPWFAILTSVPAWAYIFTLACSTWIYYTRLTELPTYLNTALKFPIQKNAFVTSMVTAAGIISGYVSAFAADAILTRKLLNTTQTRKLMEVIAQAGTAACLIGVTFSGCNTTLVIALLMLSCVFLTVSSSGVGVTAMDMAPAFSGTVFGIGNTVSSATGFITPLVTGMLLTGNNILDGWHYVFYVSAAVGVVGCCTFLILGSAEPQKWNFDEEKEADDEEAVVRKFTIQ